jgi:hypothetical protein
VTDPLAGRLLHDASLCWPGASGRGSVVLPLPVEYFRDLPSRLSVDGLPFLLKDEFHMTVFDTQEWRKVQAAHGDAAVAAAAAALDWRMHVDGACWLVQRPDATGWRTVIATLHAPAMAQLRDSLRSADCPLATPTPHVTLYCSDARGGIGVSGPGQWRERVVAALRIDWQAQVALRALR